MRGSPCILRPDLQCVISEREGKITLVDMTIPFEFTGEAFIRARDKKERKYGELVE